MNPLSKVLISIFSDCTPQYPTRLL